MNRKTKNAPKTRNMVLDKTNELINRDGIVDFRIDSLSAGLGISPGNITYHFPRKDDISYGLWDECLEAIMKNSEGYITSLIDLKQVFLLCRSIVNTLNRYRGVACHMLSDISMMSRLKDEHRKLLAVIETQYTIMVAKLQQNGYIMSDATPTDLLLSFKLFQISLGWSITMSQKEQSDNKEFNSDKLALLALYSAQNILTAKGKKQLKKIENEI